jgi:hypothetical protein
MPTVYTRQASFSNGDVIDAPLFNAEFDQLVDVSADLNAYVTALADNLVLLESSATDASTAAGLAQVAAELAETNAEAAAELLPTSVATPSKAAFFALAEQRIRESAGSGFSEWGKQRNDGTFTPVNNGITANVAIPNILRLGYDFNVGVSRTQYSIVNVNGVAARISSTNINSEALSQLTFPPAPNGTKTRDSANGVVVQHADSATAFAAETATNKVIISRKDFAFIESWHELVSEKDVVYPLGNTQYGVSTWGGITLSNALVAQGYSAFGAWDTVTTGYGVVWSTLSEANKLIFLQDKDNNMYTENGVPYQVRYRARVVEGQTDTTGVVTSALTGGYARFYKMDAVNASDGFISPQGKSVVPVDSTNNSSIGGTFLSGSYSVFDGTDTILPQGTLVASKTVLTSTITGDASFGHNGLCFSIPVATVQRRNEGAYHPVYNPNGVGLFINTADGGGAEWYSNGNGGITSTVICFNQVAFGTTGVQGVLDGAGQISVGAGQVGRPDDKFYDAIYASDVKDNRMSTEDLPYSEIRKRHKRDSISGAVRGFEGVPFTKVYTQAFSSGAATSLNIGNTAGISVGDIVYSERFDNASPFYDFAKVLTISSSSVLGLDRSVQREAGGLIVIALQQNHKQANPSWTDIVGTPAKIAATFPNGVEAQWIPLLPTGVALPFALNRKCTDSDVLRTYTGDNGATWVSNTGGTFSGTTNTDTSGFTTNDVVLLQYTTQAHFTQVALNSKVLDLGSVWAGSHPNSDWGCILQSSLINVVGIGASNPRLGNFGEVRNYVFRPSDGTLFDDSNSSPTHDTISIENATAVKTLDYLSSLNGVATLNYAYKEMVWDTGADGTDDFINITSASTSTTVVGSLYHVTDGPLTGFYRCLANKTSIPLSDSRWSKNADGDIVYGGNATGLQIYFELWDGNGFGDNGKFEIIDNQGTLTDDNGNPVLYGSALFNTQYFIKER